MRDVVVAGVGMTTFGKQTARPFTSLVREATSEALRDAGCEAAAVQFVYYANTMAGILQGQESVRGQHAVGLSGLDGIPLVNVENACASGSTALNQAWLAVASGHVDVAIAIGAEKLTHLDKARSIESMSSALDQTRLDEIRAELGDGTGSVFMDIYAQFAQWYMERSEATVADFARVAVKNHAHGSLNPKAQYGSQLSVDDVVSARPISGPLTLPMCAPMSDGAAAAVVTTREVARRWGSHAVGLAATTIGASRRGEYGQLVRDTARRAYEIAGIAPSDVDVVECHDAASPAELIVSEELELCGPGEAVEHLRNGTTALGGHMPINPSGGLVSKGHPIGATGIAQVVELVDQLRGRCGARQVAGARVALAENAGGYLGPDAAVATVTILKQ